MLINYDGKTKNSVVYVAAQIKSLAINNIIEFQIVLDYCKENSISYSLMIYAIDWLYLMKMIKSVETKVIKL